MRLDEDLNIGIHITIRRDTYEPINEFEYYDPYGYYYDVEIEFRNEGGENERLENELFDLNTQLVDCNTTQEVFYKLSELFKEYGSKCKGSEVEDKFKEYYKKHPDELERFKGYYKDDKKALKVIEEKYSS